MKKGGERMRRGRVGRESGEKVERGGRREGGEGRSVGVGGMKKERVWGGGRGGKERGREKEGEDRGVKEEGEEGKVGGEK